MRLYVMFVKVQGFQPAQRTTLEQIMEDVMKARVQGLLTTNSRLKDGFVIFVVAKLHTISGLVTCVEPRS